MRSDADPSDRLAPTARHQMPAQRGQTYYENMDQKGKIWTRVKVDTHIESLTLIFVDLDVEGWNFILSMKRNIVPSTSTFLKVEGSKVSYVVNCWVEGRDRGRR